MKKTPTYNYNMPDRDDKVKIGDLNQNAQNIDIDLNKLDANVKTKAPIDSPTFSGTPKAPNPTTNKTERIATDGYVKEALMVEKL